jgi:hypothetical protein
MGRQADLSACRTAICKTLLASSGAVPSGLGAVAAAVVIVTLLRSRQIFPSFDLSLIEVRDFFGPYFLYLSSGFALWIFDGNFGAPAIRILNGLIAV